MNALATGALVFAVSVGCSDLEQSVNRAIPESLPDSGTVADYEDSVMGTLTHRGRGVVTKYGDTLATFGGWSVQVEGPPWYEIAHYSRNSIHYLGIERRGQHKPVGRPVWSRRFILRLPPMDSTDHVVVEGLCEVDGKEDRLVYAITGTEGDAFLRPARHAWRFNINREALEEISAAGVMCSHTGGAH